MYYFLKALALPPFNLLVTMAVGLILVSVGRQRAGLIVTWVSLGFLVLLSTDQFALRLMNLAETSEVLLPHELNDLEAEAIVILGASADTLVPEYGNPRADHLSLVRLRYGAYLHHKTGLPVLVSGGPSRVSGVVIADALATDLKESFNVQVRWRERQSRNTQENAVLTAATLQAEGISDVVLVTEAFHIPRATAAFRAAGLNVVPAPTAFAGVPVSFRSFLPSVGGLTRSYYAFHELAGRAWYELRYF